jgi:hypothetical protein
MPIENPVIQQIGGPVGSAAPVSFDVAGLDRALDAAATVGGGLLIEQRVNELTEALSAEESAYQAELHGLIKERDAPSKNQVLFGGQEVERDPAVNPQAYEMLAAISAETSAHEQGLISQQRLGVRKEAIFREYAARYPRLIPDFLKVANSSGLGGTASLQTQEMVDYLNDGAVQAAKDNQANAAAAGEYRKTLEKNSRILGVEPPPPTAGPQELVSWMDKYLKAAQRHQSFKQSVETTAILSNNREVEGWRVTDSINQVFAANGGAIIDGISAAFDARIGSVVGSNDPAVIAEFIKNSGNADRVRVALQQEAEQYKSQLMRDLGANGVVGQRISPAQWDAYWGPFNAFVTSYTSLVGTKEFSDTMKYVQEVNKVAAENAVGFAEIALQKLSADAARSNNPLAAVVNQNLSESLARRIADAAKSVSHASDLSAYGAAPAGSVPLVSPDGKVNATTGYNAFDAARAHKDIKNPKDVDAAVAVVVDKQRVALEAPKEISPDATVAATAQVIAVTGELGDRIITGRASGRPYTPDDGLVRATVRALSSDRFLSTAATMDPETQKRLLASAGPVLEQELAYIAYQSNKGMQHSAPAQRSVDNLLFNAAAAMSGGAKGRVDDAPGKAMYVIDVHPSTGAVTLRVRDGVTVTDENRNAVNTTISRFNASSGPRMGAAVRALKGLGSIKSYEDAYTVMGSALGFPQHLLPEVPEDDKK